MAGIGLEPDLRTGNGALDAYLDSGYAEVRGMSSRFSAAICAFLLRHQASLGIAGGFCEIGTFEGRFFIAMALALQPGEKSLGIDSFDWPSPRVEGHFRENCLRYGVTPQAFEAWKTDAGAITPDALFRRMDGQVVRFFHIDGDHSPAALSMDLELALAALHPDGLICLDDMLHPAYPFLVTAVQTFLERHVDLCVMAVLDREDIVGAAKFLICRKAAVRHYEQALMDRFPQRHFVLGGDALGHHCVVLTPSPRIAVVD